MTNAEKFKEIFKEFVTEVWAFSEKDFLEWLNAEYKESTTENEVKYCDRNICLKNEYNNIGCEDCEYHNGKCLYYDPEEETFDYEECFRDSGGWE